MQPADAEELYKYLQECSRDVFIAYAIAIQPENADTEEDLNSQKIASFIGFSGDVLRGTLTLVAPLALIRVAYPLPNKVDVASEEELFDWTGEIVNQLLGRLKNKLHARGVDLQASTPRTMLANHLRITTSSRGESCSLRFRVGGTQLSVWFDAIANEGVTLFGPAKDHDACAAEGELVLF